MDSVSFLSLLEQKSGQLRAIQQSCACKYSSLTPLSIVDLCL